MADHYATREFSIHDLEAIPHAEILAAQPRPGAGVPLVKFENKEFKDEATSAARGRYVPRYVETITIIIAGDKHAIVERRVKPSDKIQFAKQYAAFKKQEEYVKDGTPLETWPMISRTQLYELKSQNIFTVEDVANLSDAQLPALGLGARNLQKYAKAFLETSEKGKASSQLIAEKERLEGQVMTLTKQVSDLVSKLEVLMAKSGQAPADAVNPIHENRVALAQTLGVADPAIVIPENYAQLGIIQIRTMCKQIADTVISTKADGIALIEDYLAKKQAAAA